MMKVKSAIACVEFHENNKYGFGKKTLNKGPVRLQNKKQNLTVCTYICPSIIARPISNKFCTDHQHQLREGY